MTVIAAVNGEYDEDPVVRTGFDLAKAYGEPLLVLHVMSNDEFADRQDSTPDYYLENAEETARSLARRVTRGTLGGIGDTRFRGEVGPVAETILDVAHELDADYLVIGGATARRSGRRCSGRSPRPS
ncbi:universal stress protein [Halosegnis marinus]|uniref:universal stress protein n=1 Tax=Halosegnis marinus TaxID=3034023 RepID=UPI00360DD410